jgi:hypothetical protein
MNYLTAWRMGDLVRMPDGEEFRLTSDGYEIMTDKGLKIVCDTDRGKPISYFKLVGKAKLIETASGRRF